MKKRENEGITLIALIITIVIMLILVAVSVQILIDSNLIGVAEEAANKTKTAYEKENDAMNSIKIGDKTLNEYINEGKPVDYEAIFATATKHPQQTETDDIGIAEDGSIVNLDLWLYTLQGEDEGYVLNDSVGCFSIPGYREADLRDGKIQGKVPMYIKEDGESNFYPVTSMIGTFFSLNGLQEAPEIPSSVVDMRDTFRGCTNLTQAPEIPSSVVDMMNTFYGCTNLTQAPKIPSTVTKMYCTFGACTNLTQAPEIPSSVVDMRDTFLNCTNLTGILEINAEPTSYDGCLKNAATAEGCALELTGPNATVLNNILDTATGNVIIKQ